MKIEFKVLTIKEKAGMKRKFVWIVWTGANKLVTYNLRDREFYNQPKKHFRTSRSQRIFNVNF